MVYTSETMAELVPLFLPPPVLCGLFHNDR
jgi:hypothetical protein